jgi:hypothetical protein
MAGQSRFFRAAVVLDALEPRRLLSAPTEAPAPIGTIEGVNFDQEGAINGGPGGFGAIPPDPSSAAGANHVVHAVGSVITFSTKAGATTFQDDLFGFFGGLAQTTLANPRVAYDHFSARWIVIALDRTDTSEGAPANTSRLFIATSDDADPNGAWSIQSINTDIAIASQPTWADFATLGLDDDAIYISTTQFRFGTFAYAGNRLQIINKAQLYAGQLSFTTHDVFAAVGAANSAGEFGLQPAIMYAAQPSGLGTYLVNAAEWQDGSGNDQLLVVRVTNPLTSPTFTATLVSAGGNIDNPATPLPGAPQNGTSVTVRPGDRRVTSNAVWLNGNLYLANTTLPQTGVDAGQSTVRWYRIAANGVAAPALVDTGIVGGEELGAGTHTFQPSVAVDNSGNLAIGFAVSNASMFPSAAYTLRLASAAAGTTQPATIYAAGEAFYVRTYRSPANQSQFNRWGDYNAMVVDPADGSFWAYNQYARTQGMEFLTEQGRWGTQLANFSAGVAVPPAPGAVDLVSTSDLGLSSTDNITSDNTPTLTGTAAPSSTVRVFAGGLLIGTAIASGGGTWSLTATPIPDGNYLVSATATNANGTSANSAPIAVTIDTAGPRVNAASFNFLTGHSASFTFNESVAATIGSGDIAVTNLTTLQAMSGLAVSYNSSSNIATLTFPGAANGILPDGNYTAVIDAAGVRDLAGNALDGDGNGAAGDNFTLSFFVLAGDANRSRAVNLDDFTILASSFGQTGRVFTQGNFNYSSDGAVNLDDFTILASQFGQSLPAPSDSPSAAGSPGIAPITPKRVFADHARIANDILES